MTISEYAFADCIGITSVSIPDSVKTIEKYAFYGCSGLNDLNIPDTVTTIGEYAFWGCSSIKNAVVPDSVTSVGQGMFGGCSNLECITLPYIGEIVPNNVGDLWQYPFGYIFGDVYYSNCYTVKQRPYEVKYPSSNDYYYCNYCIPYTLKTVIVTGTTIQQEAFKGCKLIENIIMIFLK